MGWGIVASPIGELGIRVEHDEALGDRVTGVRFGRPKKAEAVEAVGVDAPAPPAGALDGVATVDAAATVGHGGVVGQAAGSGEVARQARAELAEYFAGERVTFDVAYAILRGSEFERAVWAQIAAIPYGETTSYGAIARAVGEPGGAQAVGLACNRNPVPIIVPCHRVIGSDGRLVGFGGGLSRKRFLLQLEARIHIERTFAP